MYVCMYASGHLHTKFHLPLSFCSVTVGSVAGGSVTVGSVAVGSVAGGSISVAIRLKATDFLYHSIVILNLQDSYQKLQTVFFKLITIH